MRKMYAWIWYGFIFLELLGLTPLLSGQGFHNLAWAQRDRYHINYFRSLSTGSIQSATVISLTNNSPNTCNVEVKWLGMSGILDCILTGLQLGQGVPIRSDETLQFCSRQVDPNVTTCSQSCTLENNEGRIEVALMAPTESCLNNLAIDTRTYFLSARTVDTAIIFEVTGIFSPRINLVPSSVSDSHSLGRSGGSGNRGE